MKTLKNIFLTLAILFFNDCSAEQVSEGKKSIVILSIDGGGVRGIIPAIILKNIEGRLPAGHHLKDYFHIMSGTSTGALICLMLNSNNKSNNNPYFMKDVIDLYKNISSDVFKSSFWYDIKSIKGLRSAKYDSSSLESYLLKYLGDSKLSDTPVNLIIPAFDLKKRYMKFFSTKNSTKYENEDYYLRDVARATTSAPTYFEAAYIKDISGSEEGIYVDGGVGVNNPTTSAIVHAIELYGRDNEIYVLSLGTGTSYSPADDNVEKLDLDIHGMGKLDWTSHIIDVLMDANTEVSHVHAMNVLGAKYYQRIQLILNLDCMDLDNGSPENIEKLTKSANDFIESNEFLLNEIATTLIRIKEKNNQAIH